MVRLMREPSRQTKRSDTRSPVVSVDSASSAGASPASVTMRSRCSAEIPALSAAEVACGSCPSGKVY